MKEKDRRLEGKLSYFILATLIEAYEDGNMGLADVNNDPHDDMTKNRKIIEDRSVIGDTCAIHGQISFPSLSLLSIRSEESASDCCRVGSLGYYGSLMRRHMVLFRVKVAFREATQSARRGGQ